MEEGTIKNQLDIGQTTSINLELYMSMVSKIFKTSNYSLMEAINCVLKSILMKGRSAGSVARNNLLQTFLKIIKIRTYIYLWL